MLESGASMAKAMGDLQTSQYNAESARFNALSNLTSSYANAVLDPLSEYAGYYMGASGGSGIQVPQLQPIQFNVGG